MGLLTALTAEGGQMDLEKLGENEGEMANRLRKNEGDQAKNQPFITLRYRMIINKLERSYGVPFSDSANPKRSPKPLEVRATGIIFNTDHLRKWAKRRGLCFVFRRCGSRKPAHKAPSFMEKTE